MRTRADSENHPTKSARENNWGIGERKRIEGIPMPTLNDSFDDIEAKDFYKMKMANALATLLDEKPFDKIRVGDICDKAGVSRQTFYRHFEAKYSVVHWFWNYCAEKSLFRVGIDLNWHDSILQNFSLIERHFDFFRIISKDHGYESCVEYGCRRRIETLTETLEKHHGMEITPLLEFQITFFAYAESRVLGRVVLLDAGKPLHPEELTDALVSCVPHDLYRLTNNPAAIS